MILLYFNEAFMCEAHKIFMPKMHENVRKYIENAYIFYIFFRTVDKKQSFFNNPE
jgi:hypothetical protein